ncbi:phosphoenolpyruvate--protein phosphotransferase [Arthrobacter sp. zg-Y1110]|uniref:phosphoenolpyruvate--protein phosphotransferase n=1 Tax=Arthrobacter sp. zg-Y1110 TaxID=2886932 RepID=UPI001D1425E0|nr:phosphoenolpyruvate--protein phosphotransferase [Arthrobacter sp. zg-Y1110]MCC3289433.1 phosphoenolpyruvate--protein phosphotransferase [Arthrobacter sp. zg-Y1110]UWX86478.1 phosphoenolpyruvate--protein phosphotransferase [Arthrobacter sp. zg-Y1110]
MRTIQGIGVSAGRVLGPSRRMPPPVPEPDAEAKPAPGSTVDGEKSRLKDAAEAVRGDLKHRAETASGDAKAVLDATAMMASDPMLLKAAGKHINAGMATDRAIWEAGMEVAAMLQSLGGYMAERTQDVLDVRARIVAELNGLPAPGIPASDVPFILTAVELAPADTATLDPAMVIGLVTSEGGPQSHTAILARSLGLPAVVGAPGADEVPDGAEIYLDGAAGTVVVEPGEEEREAAHKYAARSALPAFNGTGSTSDGYLVPLLANVGSGKDARAAAEAGAEGIGLLRTEFCFLGRDTEPTIEEQVAAYGAVFEAFPGRKVVIRTLDAGADKPLPFLTDTTEPNPALGVRGFRTDRSTPGVLARQLEAIAAAAGASTADVWVMAPMVSTAEEAADFAVMCAGAGLGMPGVMVEVPSAAIMSEAILSRVRFASLGTNDLTQYTMASDRQLGSLASLNDPWQPAVLQLISATVAGAARATALDPAAGARTVGVCGEAAADPALAVVLAGMGVNTLSMTPRALSTVGTVLASVTHDQAKELSARALAAHSAAEARTIVRSRLPILEQLGL